LAIPVVVGKFCHFDRNGSHHKLPPVFAGRRILDNSPFKQFVAQHARQIAEAMHEAGMHGPTPSEEMLDM